MAAPPCTVSTAAYQARPRIARRRISNTVSRCSAAARSTRASPEVSGAVSNATGRRAEMAPDGTARLPDVELAGTVGIGPVTTRGGGSVMIALCAAPRPAAA
jgi:hypothetical protein